MCDLLSLKAKKQTLSPSLSPSFFVLSFFLLFLFISVCDNFALFLSSFFCSCRVCVFSSSCIGTLSVSEFLQIYGFIKENAPKKQRSSALLDQAVTELNTNSAHGGATDPAGVHNGHTN